MSKYVCVIDYWIKKMGNKRQTRIMTTPWTSWHVTLSGHPVTTSASSAVWLCYLIQMYSLHCTWHKEIHPHPSSHHILLTLLHLQQRTHYSNGINRLERVHTITQPIRLKPSTHITQKWTCTQFSTPHKINNSFGMNSDL